MTDVHSDWSDWLPREIEAADPDGLWLWYLGCNGFALKSSGDTTVFVDSYLGTGDPPRTIRMIPVPFEPEDVAEADAVFATHEHTDHTHGPSQHRYSRVPGPSFTRPVRASTLPARRGGPKTGQSRTTSYTKSPRGTRSTSGT